MKTTNEVAVPANEWKRLKADAEKFHKLMRAIKDSRMEHGRCESPNHIACTACMATVDLNTMISEYRGRIVRLH